MPDVVVERLRPGDLDRVVTIHLEAFPDSAISAFGREAIRRYYTWLLEGPHDAALTGASIDGVLVGFCAAGVFRGAMNGFLRANRRYLAVRALTHPRLFLNPLIRDRIKLGLQISVRFSRYGRSPTKVAASPSFGILSIATSPSVRGAGAGRALALEAEARARAGGYSRMTLTVHPDNDRAIRFYEALGWTRRLDQNGAWSGSMLRELD